MRTRAGRGIFRALSTGGVLEATGRGAMAAVPVVVFSDFACPFSCVTEAALRRMEAAGEVEPAYLAWELHPPGTPLPAAEPAEWLDALGPLADELDLPLRLPAPVRTRKAHEAAAFAAGKGLGGAMRDALFAAHFADGRDIGRIDVLVEIGAGIGLDASELKVALDVDALAARVAAEREAADRAGVEGTPTLVIGTGREARWLVGARPFAELRAAILEGG